MKKDNQNPIQIHIDDSQYHREQEKKIKKIEDEYKKRESKERARNDERYDDLKSDLFRKVESYGQKIASHLEEQKYEAERKKKQKEEQQRQLEEDKKNTIQENHYRKLSNVLPISSSIKLGRVFSASEYQDEINKIFNQIEKLNQNGMRDLDIKFYSPKESKNFELRDKKNPYYFKLKNIEAKNTYRFKKHYRKSENIPYVWGSKCEVNFKLLTPKETLIERKIRAESRAEQEKLRAEQEKLRAEQEKLRIEAEKKELDDIMTVARMPLADREKAATRDADKTIAKTDESRLSNPKAPKIITKTDESRLSNPKAPSYLNPQLTPNETSQSSLFNFESSVRRLLVTILTKSSNLFASTIGKILGFIIRKNNSKEKKGKPTGR